MINNTSNITISSFLTIYQFSGIAGSNPLLCAKDSKRSLLLLTCQKFPANNSKSLLSNNLFHTLIIVK